MIYKNKIIVLSLFCMLPFLYGCARNDIANLDQDESWNSHRPALVVREKLEEKNEINGNAINLLDILLSPFEDMTEYALKENLDGMNKTFVYIKENRNRYPDFYNEIKNLESSVKEHNYKAASLISTNLFKKNLDNYRYSNYVREQIHLENLDYMGYKILALLKQSNIDFTEIEKSIIAGKDHWLAINDKVKDENSHDAFELLFEGLELSVKNKDINMLQIFASLDLSLVDIVEVDFR